MLLRDFIHEHEDPKLDGVLHEPRDLPDLLPVRALFLLNNGIFLTGMIVRDGTPRIYDFGRDRYVLRDNWDGIAYWMLLPG